MIAAGQWQPVIRESELPGGNFQKLRASAKLVARALRPPPPTCFTKQEGPLATQQLRIHGRKITNRQRLRQHAALVARAAWLKQSRRRFRGDSGKSRNPRLMRSGVAGPGPHSILSVDSSQFSAENPHRVRDLLAEFPQKMHALWSSGHAWLRG
jgi:hypothetical protein